MCVQFSAVHSQPWSGKKKFISAGASVSGVSWNTIRTPSTTSSSPVAVISSVGAIRPGRPERDRLAEPAVDVPRGPGGSSGPNWYMRATGHREAGDHVLADRLAQEVLGRDDPAPPGIDVRLRRHAEHAAEVIGVRVGVDDGDDRPLAEMGVGELQARLRARLDGERVDHDPPGRRRR